MEVLCLNPPQPGAPRPTAGACAVCRRGRRRGLAALRAAARLPRGGPPAAAAHAGRDELLLQRRGEAYSPPAPSPHIMPGTAMASAHRLHVLDPRAHQGCDSNLAPALPIAPCNRQRRGCCHARALLGPPSPLALQYGAQLTVSRGSGLAVGQLLAEVLLKYGPSERPVLCNGAAALGALCLQDHLQQRRRRRQHGAQQGTQQEPQQGSQQEPQQGSQQEASSAAAGGEAEAGEGEGCGPITAGEPRVTQVLGPGLACLPWKQGLCGGCSAPRQGSC